VCRFFCILHTLCLMLELFIYRLPPDYNCHGQKRNMWSFSPKHFFTDSSGAYWRERRLRPGMYTDGVNVFEASYRYRDGRNGMHPVSTLQQFLRSTSVDDRQKARIVKRLQEAEPDVVLEL
jgi:hypothetical protein